MKRALFLTTIISMAAIALFVIFQSQKASAMVPPPAGIRFWQFSTPTPVSPPTLIATLTANPSSGLAPLATTITANVTGGTATGTMNYTLWWNCANASNSVAAASASIASGGCGAPQTYGTVLNATNSPVFTTNHIYSNSGVYNVKVIIERGAAVPVDLHADVSATAQATKETLEITSLTANPSSGVQLLDPNLTINYNANLAGPWDVYIYCKTKDATFSKSYLNRPDASVTSIPGKAPPWFGGSISLSSTCVYTGTNYGSITMRVVMKNSASPTILDSAETTISVVPPTDSVAVYATGTGSTAAINAQFDQGNLPGTGVIKKYTMYCDENNISTVVASGWSSQASSANDKMSMGDCNYSTPGQIYYPKVIVEYPGYPNVANKTAYSYVSPVTLTASLAASPNPAEVGQPVSLTAKITGGSASGNVNYSFYCNDTDTAAIKITNNTSATSQTASDVCTYGTSGSYKPKVVVTRQGVSVQPTTTLSVVNSSPVTVSVSLSASPNPVMVNQTVSLTATVAGSAVGSIVYEFYCLNTSTTYDKTVTSGSSPVTADGLCKYSVAGTFTAKVIVKRQAKTAQDTVAITVSASGSNGQIIFEENGGPIKIRGSLVASQVIFNARNKGTEKYSVRIFSDKNVLASRLPGFSDIMSVVTQSP